MSPTWRHTNMQTTWLLEPSDQPVGKGLETFYKNFEKRVNKMKEAAEKYVLDSNFLAGLEHKISSAKTTTLKMSLTLEHQPLRCC